MPWPFSRKPKKDSVEYWLNWAEEQMEKGVSRQDVCDALLHVDYRKLDGREMGACSEAHRRISGVFVDRNLTGRELERQGDIDRAIALYEANLVDGFEGSHPYERLRIIYAKRKDYANAIRVCQAFVALPTRGSTNPKKIKRFQEWIYKYKARME